MRLSVLTADPGYHEQAWRAEIFLDGKRLTQVYTADEEKGEVLVWTGGRGLTRDATLDTRTETGVVAIRLPHNWRERIEADQRRRASANVRTTVSTGVLDRSPSGR